MVQHVPLRIIQVDPGALHRQGARCLFADCVQGSIQRKLRVEALCRPHQRSRSFRIAAATGLTRSPHLLPGGGTVGPGISRSNIAPIGGQERQDAGARDAPHIADFCRGQLAGAAERLDSVDMDLKQVGDLLRGQDR